MCLIFATAQHTRTEKANSSIPRESQKRRESVLTSDQDFKKTYDTLRPTKPLVKERYKEFM